MVVILKKYMEITISYKELNGQDGLMKLIYRKTCLPQTCLPQTFTYPGTIRWSQIIPVYLNVKNKFQTFLTIDTNAQPVPIYWR